MFIFIFDVFVVLCFLSSLIFVRTSSLSFCSRILSVACGLSSPALGLFVGGGGRGVSCLDTVGGVGREVLSSSSNLQARSLGDTQEQTQQRPRTRAEKKSDEDVDDRAINNLNF